MTTPDSNKMRYENRERIRVLETEMGYIKQELGEIKNNHLKHVQDTLDRIETRINKSDVNVARLGVKVGAIVTVAVVIIQQLISYIVESL